MQKIKFIAITLLLLCVAFSIKAQTERGTFLIGGATDLSVSILNSKYKSDRGDGDLGSTSTFTFTPELGVFLADGLMLGIKTPMSYSKSVEKYENSDDVIVRQEHIGWEPFVKYYFGSKDMKPYVYSGLGLGDSELKYERGNLNEEQTRNEYFYEIGGGLAVFINDKLSFNIGLGYGSTTYEQNENNEENYKTTDTGISFDIGFSLFF